MARASRSDSRVDLEAELRALYAEVDVLYAGFSCPASTECCRFGVTGREPHVTSIELSLVLRAAARLGKPLIGTKRASKRALPVLPSDEASSRNDRRARPERACPMLSDEGRCSIYEDRPFGCRTYYCDRATKVSKIRHSTVTDLVRRLKDLSARHEPGGDEGRPFVRALELGAGRARLA